MITTVAQDPRSEKIVGRREGRESRVCPLCQCNGVRVVDQFSFGDLRQLYLRTCGIDILECLDETYKDELIYLHECQECGLEFYPSELCGNEKLYKNLQRFDYYYMKDKWEFATALLEVLDAQKILEVGCGTGLFIEKVRSIFPEKRIKGLELNSESVQICREKGLDVEARTLEEFAPENDGTFDLVCAFQVLEHVPTPDGFLRAAFRCLRPGGLCVLSVPNRDGFTRYAVNDFGNMPPHHITRWNAGVVRNIAAKYEAKVERILEEPVAEYHKAWYRDTLIVRTLSAAIRLRWRRVEVGTRYRVMLGFSRRLQRVIPERLWCYSGYSGHTLYVALRKCLE